MAKRFYDSNKYDDAWFRNLSPELKCVYDYCLCKCDHAGIVDIDIEGLNWHTKGKTTLEEIKQAFENKFLFLSETKVFIPKFIYWQYKNELNPSNAVHRCVYDLLVRESINAEQFLAPKVLTEDFENWSELLKQMKADKQSYKDLLNSR